MIELLKLLLESKDSVFALLLLVIISPTAVILYAYIQEKRTNKILQQCLITGLAEIGKTLTEAITMLEIYVYRGKR